LTLRRFEKGRSGKSGPALSVGEVAAPGVGHIVS
jgi:hypothetical protein